ncbi:hypothetical protein EUGRSUZ_I02223 [Eucalyptus grandis]|uniref:Uncharacterized protein n=2 Tax=Eucalyptus grandis TaxID=71139 RepID=A0ACC3JHY5_EUCGR|nr:hypothetical protein EUGRSUZ_I02223 [Eucalyptus grandis]
MVQKSSIKLEKVKSSFIKLKSDSEHGRENLSANHPRSRASKEQDPRGPKPKSCRGTATEYFSFPNQEFNFERRPPTSEREFNTRHTKSAQKSHARVRECPYKEVRGLNEQEE